MKTIWKFELHIDEPVTLLMPVGAEVLTVQAQGDIPCIWAIVDPNAETETRRFYVRGTGHPLREVGRYVDTFQLNGGALVFHLFEAT